MLGKSFLGASIIILTTSGLSAGTVDLTALSSFGGTNPNGMASISGTVDGIGFTFSSIGGPLYWDGTDGLGIKTGELDEVEHPEILHLHFDAPVDFVSFDVSDLFIETRNGITFTERGAYSLEIPLYDGSGILQVGGVEFLSTSNHCCNGEQTELVNLSGITDIYFSAPGNITGPLGPEDHEFSLQAFTVYAYVTEPASLGLLGSSLLLLGFVSRRLRKRTA